MQPSEMESTQSRPTTPVTETAAPQKTLNEIFEAERVVYVMEDISDVDLEPSKYERCSFKMTAT